MRAISTSLRIAMSLNSTLKVFTKPLFENTFNTVQDILDGKRKKQPKLQQQADKLTERIQSVQDKYFDGGITKEEKIEAVERYTAEQNELRNQTSDMPLLR